MCFRESNDKGHIINIHIKYTITILVQYKIAEDAFLSKISVKNMIKSKSTTHSCDIDCKIRNNPLCKIYEHLR